MGFRFRRSIKIAPGIRLNVSKSGVSTSIGGSGATINLSRRGAKATVGIPGTGISYSESLSSAQRSGSGVSSNPRPRSDARNLLLGVAFVAVLFLIGWLMAKL
jgi:cobalamin biosynthesis Mg chelatase CobN